MTAHVVVLHRWRAPYALYENYIDHNRHAVTYVSSEIGLAGVPHTASGVEIVTATDSIDEVRAATARLVGRFGAPTAIIALKEDDLLTAAQLTAEYDLPGRRPADLEVFRDKLAMAVAVQATSLAQPHFASAIDAADVQAFGESHGWPVVVKPRFGSSSDGVRVFHRDTLDPTWRADDGGAMVQSYVDGVLLHVDGVFDGVDLGLWRVHRYLGSPLDFRAGGWIGSVEVDDASTTSLVESYTTSLLRGLTQAPTVFHLEVFVRSDDRGEPSCVFVEIAARAGGAEIPFLWREVHGFDLVGEAFRLALGANTTPGPATVEAGCGGRAGLLLVAAPAERPCRITATTSVLGTRWAPRELYCEVVPKVGDVVSAAPAFYEHVGGRFRFSGESTREVENAIFCVAERFAIEGVAQPVDALVDIAWKESV